MRVWKEYGNAPNSRFLLMFSRHAVRWFDAREHKWVGPELTNVAPAVAWALECAEAPAALKRQEWGWAS